MKIKKRDFISLNNKTQLCKASSLDVWTSVKVIAHLNWEERALDSKYDEMARETCLYRTHVPGPGFYTHIY